MGIAEMHQSHCAKEPSFERELEPWSKNLGR